MRHRQSGIENAASRERRKDRYLPSLAGGDFIESLKKPETEPGGFAG